MKAILLSGLAAAALLLSACSEKPQTAGTLKSDAKAWSGAEGGQVASGWKPGDQGSWEEQLRTRAQQGQNEYTRAPAKP